MFTPKEFAVKTGLSYSRVLQMCKTGEIEAVNQNKASGSHFYIPEKELDKYYSKDGFVTKEEYEKVLRENEKLKTLLNNVKSFVLNIA